MSAPRRGRAAAVALVLGLTLAAGAGGSASGDRDDLRYQRIAAARATMERLHGELDLAGPAIALLEKRVARVGSDLATLTSSVAAAGAEIQARRRDLDRRVGSAREMVTGTIDGPPAVPGSFSELSAPLEVVSRAIHGGDELGIELLEQQDTVQRQSRALRQLMVDLRLARFEIAAKERVVREWLAEATEAAHSLAENGAPPEVQRTAGVIEEAQAQLRAVQTAEAELRRTQSEVLQASMSLAALQTELRSGLGRARRTLDALYEDMAVAETLVSGWMELWDGPVDGSVPPGVSGVFSVCPVDEPRAYSDDWGAPRWGGGFHLHQGNDIFAPEGTPIRAPFDGTAVVADNTLGGMAVKVFGKPGYVYNAHLSAYGTLGPVTAGTIIGRVGNTGDAVNTPPHDHFEFHPGNGVAVDPFPYLNAVC